MKLTKFEILATVVLTLTLATAALAGGRYSGGYWPGIGGSISIYGRYGGVTLGIPAIIPQVVQLYYLPSYDELAAYHGYAHTWPYSPPSVIVPRPAPPPVQYWYYCEYPSGYYPYVAQCPSGWRMVPATPQE